MEATRIFIPASKEDTDHDLKKLQEEPWAYLGLADSCHTKDVLVNTSEDYSIACPRPLNQAFDESMDDICDDSKENGRPGKLVSGIKADETNSKEDVTTRSRDNKY